MRNGTFVLNGLALGGWSPFGDGPAHEVDEFSDARPLEVAEMVHVRRVRQYHRVGSFRVAFQQNTEKGYQIQNGLKYEK